MVTRHARRLAALLVPILIVTTRVLAFLTSLLIVVLCVVAMLPIDAGAT